MELTASQRLKREFDRQGFLVIRSFLDPLQVEHVQQRMDTYVRDIVPLLPRGHAFYEDRDNPETLKQLQYVSNHDVFFGRLYQSERLVGLAELLLATPVRTMHVQWFNKPPHVSTPTPPHQDGHYWMLDPNEGLTMWLALDRANDENGCVRYVAGSHLEGLRPHGRTDTIGFSQGITDFGDRDRAHEVAIHAEPGDLLIHHALTIHSADRNKSNRSRRALGLIYLSRYAREDTANKEAYRKALSADLVQAGKL